MERETDHGGIAWGNNLMQFRQSRQFECLVKSLFAPVNALHEVFYDLLYKRGVDTAEGKQLDGVGRIVGLTRTVSNAAAIPFFGFDGQENILGFGQPGLSRLISPSAMKSACSAKRAVLSALAAGLSRWTLYQTSRVPPAGASGRVKG